MGRKATGPLWVAGLPDRQTAEILEPILLREKWAFFIGQPIRNMYRLIASATEATPLIRSAEP